MAQIDIFNNDAFGLVEMTGALERIPYRPQLLGELNIFTPKPISTTVFGIENRGNKLSVIQSTPRGAPLPQLGAEGRRTHFFETVRIAKGDRLNASEIQNVRAFGTQSELMSMQIEVLRRQTRLRNDAEITLERHRFGALRGVVLDANDDVLFNWYDLFGIAPPAVIDFELDDEDADVRGKLRNVKRRMQVASQRAWRPGTRVAALAGDNFYDALVNHKQIKETKVNTDRGAAMLEDIEGFSSIETEGITFINYRGVDDGSDISIGTDEVQFFPVGSDVMEHVMSPGEWFDVVNTPGRQFYALTIPDEKRNAFVDLEVYSYPAMVATRPEMLLRGIRA